MATLHLLYGFTGAGQTTFARKLEHDIAAIRFTPDEWMTKLYGYNPPEQDFAEYFSCVTDLIWELTLKLLQVGQDVILDFGFWSRASRDEARYKAQTVNATIKLYFISCPEKIMQKRVMKRNYELAEGVLHIDEHAFELFKKRFEPLGKDELHFVINT